MENNCELYLKNLLSFRGTISQQDIPNELSKIEKFIENNNLKINGPKISTTFSANNSSMDIEILIPIDKEFVDNDLYTFKKELKLVNCLKINCQEGQSAFQGKVLELQNYIVENKLITISSLYTIVSNDTNIDAYISISPNIL